MRLRFKIPLFGLLTIAAVIVTGVVLFYRSHLLENWVNRYLADRVARSYNLDVTIGEIEGSFFEGFVLRNVLVQMRRPQDTVMLADLPSIAIHYNISNLWHRQWIIDSLEFYQPRLFLTQDTTGRWVLPEVPEAQRSQASGVTWQCRTLAIIDGSFALTLGKQSYEWSAINLYTALYSDTGVYRVRLDSLRADCSDGRLRIRSAGGMASVIGQKLICQNITLAGDSSRAAFSLTREPGGNPPVDVTIDSAHVHLRDIVSFFGSPLSGEFDLRGKVQQRPGEVSGDVFLAGTFERRRFDSLQTRFRFADKVLHLDSLDGAILNGCAIAGRGAIDFTSRPQTYQLSADMQSFDLNNLVFESFSSNLSGHLEADGRGFGARTMAINLDLLLDESYFDIYHFHQAAGRMLVTVDSLSIAPGFQVYYHDNEFVAEGVVDYDSVVDVRGTADLANLADFAHQTFIDLPAGRAKAEFAFTGPPDDPRLWAHCRSDSIWLYEFFSRDFETSFDIESFLYQMRGPVTLRCRAGDAWGFPFDSLWAAMRLDSNLLHIDTGSIFNDFSQTAVRGVFDMLSYPQVLTLDTVTVNLVDRQLTSDGVQTILVDSTGYALERVGLTGTGGRIAVSGRANYDESLDIGWNIENAAIRPWVILVDDSLQFDGTFSSAGRLTGTLAEPRFTLEAGVDGLRYQAAQSIQLGDLRTFVRYADTTLVIDSFYLKSPGGIYRASGEFPINLTMAGPHDLFDQREQNIIISASDKRLDLVPFFLESVEYVNGDLSAEIKLTGRPTQPHLNGTCRLDNGVIKLVDLKDLLEQMAIEITMADQLVTVTRAEAMVVGKNVKTTGKVSGSGTIRLNDINTFIYGLKLTAVNLPIDYELGKFQGLADADISVDGPTPPKVSGKIIMHSALYGESFETTGFSLLSALEGDKTWDLDLNVDFPSNFRVENDDVEAEFFGNIVITRTAGKYNFIGMLEVVRGKYQLFDKTFTMTPGGQINYSDIKEPDPSLDLEITTRIRAPGRPSEFESETNYSYELILRVTGTLLNPIISGGGDAPISNEDIMPVLVAGYMPDAQAQPRNQALTERITVGGVKLLAAQVSRFGTRSLGLETFEIDPAYGRGVDPLGTRLTVGAYTLPNLYVFGSSYFDINRGQEVGMEYRLGRHYLFEGRRDESSLYRFNIKFEWEY
jgi:hypothetical protein